MSLNREEIWERARAFERERVARWIHENTHLHELANRIALDDLEPDPPEPVRGVGS